MNDDVVMSPISLAGDSLDLPMEGSLIMLHYLIRHSSAQGLRNYFHQTPPYLLEVKFLSHQSDIIAQVELRSEQSSSEQPVECPSVAEFNTPFFSSDYRQVKWHGQTYKLTKKQATVLETLVREHGRAHKDLLCAEAETNQALFHLFRRRVDGKFIVHPFWGNLIKPEGDGYYMLIT